jgi:hypothetical protein
MFLETQSFNRVIIENSRSVSGVIITGQNLAEGTLVGRITASGKFTLCVGGSADGSEIPYGVVHEAIDATSEDKTCALLVAGVVVEDALVVGGTHTLETVRDVLRDAGIFLETVIDN